MDGTHCSIQYDFACFMLTSLLTSNMEIIRASNEPFQLFTNDIINLSVLRMENVENIKGDQS